MTASEIAQRLRDRNIAGVKLDNDAADLIERQAALIEKLIGVADVGLVWLDENTPDDVISEIKAALAAARTTEPMP